MDERALTSRCALVGSFVQCGSKPHLVALACVGMTAHNCRARVGCATFQDGTMSGSGFSPCRRCARLLERAESWRSGRVPILAAPNRAGKHLCAALAIGSTAFSQRMATANASAGGAWYSPLLLAGRSVRPHAPGIFVVSEAEAAAIRTAFDRGGELSAAVEQRRLFPGITDVMQARECARTIAGWKPLPAAPRSVRRLHQRRGREP